jgi:hypothetical protein
MSEGHTSVSHDPDDLRDASRERLLAEIGRLNHLYQLQQLPELQQRLARMEMELLQNRDYVRGLMAENGELKARMDAQQRELQRELRRKTRKLDEVRKTMTWRLGSTLMLPVRIFRRIAGRT